MQKLIILPGWGGTSETWQDFVEIAKADFDVQVINLPCFGDEPCPDNVWGVEEYSNFVKDKLEKLKAESRKPVAILGHSFGGQVASYLTANNPSLVHKLVLSGPAVFRSKKKIRRIIIAGIAKTGKWIFRLPLLEKADVEVEKIFRRVTRSQDYADTSGIKRDIFMKVIREDLTEVVKKIKMPTLIIWGTKDNYVPVKNAYKLNKLILNSKLEIIKGGKHGLHIQQPEVLLEKIKNFYK
ncbi:MAG: alpha/beta hydrolase [Candidatus Magasanikbacteria bacterium]